VPARMREAPRTSCGGQTQPQTGEESAALDGVKSAMKKSAKTTRGWRMMDVAKRGHKAKPGFRGLMPGTKDQYG
jgi:hypothetical protein